MHGVPHRLFTASANVFLTASTVGIELPILSVGSGSANHLTNRASLAGPDKSLNSSQDLVPGLLESVAGPRTSIPRLGLESQDCGLESRTAY